MITKSDNDTTTTTTYTVVTVLKSALTFGGRFKKYCWDAGQISERFKNSKNPPDAFENLWDVLFVIKPILWVPNGAFWG